MFHLLSFAGFGIVAVLFSAKITIISKDKNNESNGDGRIREVEYRIKKGECFAAYQWHPFGPSETKQRKVEHVDYHAMEQFTISITPRYNRCDLGRKWIVEDFAIE